MLIVGLTGSIGMGKSTAAAHFMTRGIAVCDADAIVHRLYEDVAVKHIEAEFPGVTYGGRIDRAKLAAALLVVPDGFARLEAIVHPLVRAEERRFLHAEAQSGAKAAILDIPLLFETGADRLVDKTIVVSAALPEQRQRVLSRPGMTEERFEKILARQMSDSEKRARADLIVDTNGPIFASHRQIDAIIDLFPTFIPEAFHRDWE